MGGQGNEECIELKQNACSYNMTAPWFTLEMNRQKWNISTLEPEADRRQNNTMQMRGHIANVVHDKLVFTGFVKALQTEMQFKDFYSNLCEITEYVQ